MNRLQIAALLTHLVRRMRHHGGWCGETHVQKSTYVAQQLAGVPLGFDFILYKHGPFSFDLRDELTSLRADDLLHLEPQAFPYGPKFKITDNARKLGQKFPKTIKKYTDALEFVAEKLADKQVDELERLATALFAKSNFAGMDDHDRAAWINQKKPHVTIEDALAALAEVDELEEEFNSELA
ncbi:MAG: hypothetical protein RIC55_26525 [Pirellulaceae bacterium]